MTKYLALGFACLPAGRDIGIFRPIRNSQMKLSCYTAIIIALCLVLAAGAALRLYRLPTLLHFADDEGRDMMIAEKIAAGEKLPSLGPSASTGNFYLGPIFYYAMGLTVKIWDHPAAPALLVVLISVATGYLLYRLGKDLFSPSAGLIMAALWSFSYGAIIQGRWAWHPNVLPLFVTAIIYCLYHIGRPKNNGWRGDNWYIVSLFAATAVAVQLHATAFLLVPAIIIYWLFFPPKVRNPWAWAGGLAVALCLVAPVLGYELKNQWANMRGALGQLREGAPYPTDNRLLYAGKSLFQAVAGLFGLTKYIWLTIVLAVPVVGVFVWSLVKKTIPRFGPIKWFIAGVLIIAMAFYLLFSGELFPHYFLLVTPIAFILVGAMWETLKQNRWQKWILIASFVVISYAGISGAINFLAALQNGQAIGSYGVPLQDERAAVAAIRKTGADSVELNTRAHDSYDRAYEYLLAKNGITVSPEASTKVVLYRTSESPSLDELESSFSSFEQKSFGAVGLLIGLKK